VGEAQEFVGDDLFLYMNGGAEIYHEYGFERLTVRDYREGEKTIAVEVYTMAGDAFGIYSFTRSEKGEAIDLGCGGSLSDYYLSFWSGRHMVVVTAQTEFEGKREAVLEIGRELAEGFPPSGERPDIFALLPQENMAQGSEKYIVGPISMQNVSYDISRLLKGFHDSAVADYVVGGRAWPGADAAVAALEEAELLAENNENAEFRRIDGGGFELHFEAGRRLRAISTGEWVVVATSRDAGSNDLEGFLAASRVVDLLGAGLIR